MPDHVFIVLQSTADGRYFLSFRDQAISPPREIEACSVRCSPAFHLSPGQFQIPAALGSYTIAFFTLPNAANVAGRLPLKLRANVLFTLGIAPLVVVTKNRNSLKPYLKHFQDHTLAYEAWDIKKGKVKIETLTHSLAAPIAFNWNDYQLPICKVRNSDVKWILTELNHNLHELTHRASIFQPSFLKTLKPIVKDVSQLADQIIFFAGETKICKSLCQGDKDKAKESDLFRKLRLNQYISYLVELNASLVYVLSQAFHGYAPLLFSNDCLIRHHSLLGVGTAHRGIGNLVGYIEAGLANSHVVREMELRYSRPFLGLVAADLNNDLIANVPAADPSKAVARNLDVDEQLPKLAYFSGRNGFGEVHYTVTAATQSLQSADSITWSLMTMTHELMHSHVEGLLSIIFDCDDDRLTEENFIRIVEEFQQDEKPIKNFSVNQYIRHKILYLVLLSVTNEEASAKMRSTQPTATLGKSPKKIAVPLEVPATSAGILENLAMEYDSLNEIIVHVLDLEYFYLGNKERYIDSLWISWSSVPGVIDRIDYYITRTLAAVGASEAGHYSGVRFDTCVTMLRSSFDRIRSCLDNSAVIEKVTSILDSPDDLRALRIRFGAYCALAELANKYLVFPNLLTIFDSNDEKISSVNGEMKYLLNSGEISGAEIENPLAFVYDRIRRRIEMVPEKLSDDYRAAWIFFMLASANTNSSLIQ